MLNLGLIKYFIQVSNGICVYTWGETRRYWQFSSKLHSAIHTLSLIKTKRLMKFR